MLVQAKYPKEHAPTAHVPALRFGQARCSIPGRRRRTRCAAWPLHSNNRGESDDEAAVSFGTAARPGLCAPSHGLKGEIREPNTGPAWADPLANLIFKPSAPIASSHCSRCGYSPSIHACGAQHAGPHGCRRTAMLRRLTCRSCSSGALKAQSEFCGRPCVLGDAGRPSATALGSGIAGAHSWPTLLCEQQGRSPAGASPGFGISLHSSA